jgi:glycosyltransferase involved in cell wall biosynthesis
LHIGIDGRLLGSKMGGIQRFLTNIIKYLPEFDQQNKYTLFVYNNIPTKNKFYSYSVIKRSRLPRQLAEHYWLNVVLPKRIKEMNIDIFFTPYVLVPIKKGNHKNVIVIHDALTKVNKSFYSISYRNYIEFFVQRAIKRSDAIITVSESAKQDLIRYYNITPDIIHPIYLWTDERFCVRNINKTEKELIQKKYNLPSKFILYVGAIDNRKNIDGIIKISDRLHSRGIDIKIVLIGKPGFGFEKLLEDINYREDRILHLDNVEEDLIPYLYNLAFLFLFPSFYEGFGIPPLEAMKSGLPVLASNTSSIPEVVGSGGLLSNPNDYEDFVSNIAKLLSDDRFYEEMKTRALAQAKKFTPDVLLPKLIKVFNNC